MLVKMKYLSIEEMHIQHIHSKTRTQFCVTSIWRMVDSIHPELTQRYFFFFFLINVDIISTSCASSIVKSRVCRQPSSYKLI
jgi:hypothetical protein